MSRSINAPCNEISLINFMSTSSETLKLLNREQYLRKEETMKTFITALLLTLATTLTGLPAHAAYQAKVPHPEGGTQTRSNGQFSPVRYSFRFHVTGYTLSELRFTAPAGMQLNRSIDIMDQNGQKVATTIELQGQVAVITFTQPVALGSKLRIDLNKVKTIDNSRIWELETSGKLDNLKEDISLQTIRLSPGYH